MRMASAATRAASLSSASTNRVNTCIFLAVTAKTAISPSFRQSTAEAWRARSPHCGDRDQARAQPPANVRTGSSFHSHQIGALHGADHPLDHLRGLPRIVGSPHIGGAPVDSVRTQE